jgi:hypothetical protein
MPPDAVDWTTVDPALIDDPSFTDPSFTVPPDASLGGADAGTGIADPPLGASAYGPPPDVVTSTGPTPEELAGQALADRAAAAYNPALADSEAAAAAAANNPEYAKALEALAKQSPALLTAFERSGILSPAVVRQYGASLGAVGKVRTALRGKPISATSDIFNSEAVKTIAYAIAGLIVVWGGLKIVKAI